MAVASSNRGHRRRWLAAAGFLATWLLGAGAWGDDRSPETFPRDQVVPQVEAGVDGSQTYALYLPPGYDPARPWAVLFVLDPRGRAETALDLFVPGARALGWIVLSSYQSRSDTDVAITTRALDALMRDADARFTLDRRRLYLGGMSGTAFLSWGYASMMAGSVAGVIGVGAGMPRELDAVGDVPFAYYGIAGWYDFNFQQQVRTDTLLDATEAPHRLALFDGPHGWSPEADTRAAMQWLELMAIQRDLRPVDDALIDAELAVARARVAEDTDPLTHLRRLRELVRDFDGLRPVAVEKAQLATLATSNAVRDARAAADRALRQERAYQTTLGQWYANARATGAPPNTKRALAALKISRLRKIADGDADLRTRASARRQIESAYVQLAFYLPRALEAEGQTAWAIALLEIAIGIKPDWYWPRQRLAEVLVGAGREKKALAALEAAVARGTNVDWLRHDATWAPLHELDGWTTLVGAPADNGSTP